MLQDQVICLTDPDLWFSDSSSDRLVAAELCNECFFKEDCKILGEKENHGVWGGVDRTGTQPKVSLCRNKKHPKEGPGPCLPCRKESQAAYYQKNSVSINKKKHASHPKIKKRKNVLGGYCVNGHLLDEKTVSIRKNDGALLCKKCRVKARIVPSQKNVRTFK